MKHLIMTYLIIIVLTVSNIYCYAKSFKKAPINEPLKINFTESIDFPEKLKITLRRMNCTWADE